MRQATTIEPPRDIAVNVASFRRHLRAENLSPRTEETYTEAVEQFARYVAARGMPLEVGHVKREHVESFIEYLLQHRKPATANNRYRGLQAFFKWCEEEGEIRTTPMARMKPPRVPETPPDVLKEDQLRALLAACDRHKDFEGQPGRCLGSRVHRHGGTSLRGY